MVAVTNIVEKRCSRNFFRLTFCRPKSLIYCFCCSDRSTIDSPIKKEHDEHRYIKAPKCAINDIAGIISQFTSPRTFCIGWCRHGCCWLQCVISNLISWALSCRQPYRLLRWHDLFCCDTRQDIRLSEKKRENLIRSFFLWQRFFLAEVGKSHKLGLNFFNQFSTYVGWKFRRLEFYIQLYRFPSTRDLSFVKI